MSNEQHTTDTTNHMGDSMEDRVLGPPMGAERPLAVGDVVRLKSGGMWMTVETICDLRAHCVWFPQGASYVFSECRSVFPIAALQLLKSAP